MDDRTLGVLGGGQLGRMLVEAANNRNISVAILDKENSPAKQINAHRGVVGSFADAEAIRKLASECDILTVEIEHVDTQVLEDLEKESLAKGKRLEIHPSWQAIRTIQDKYLQKLTLEKANVGLAKSIPIDTASEEAMQTAANILGLPFMLKARKGAYDGRGNYPVRSAEDFKPALHALRDQLLYAEQWVDFKKELAVMVVKTEDEPDPSKWSSSTLSYPTVETVHEDSICKLVFAPARDLSKGTNSVAQEVARKAVASFKGKGIYGVEMFLLGDNIILVNEIAPRPHNSGHYTIEACRMSQYDSHLLAILERPIADKGLQLVKPAIMLNILGGSDPKSFLELANAADAIGAKVHLYGKGDATKGRKMGHLTVLGDTMEEAEQMIHPLIDIAIDIRAGRPIRRTNNTSTKAKNKPQPVVGIITGSISDQPHLEACYKIFDDFGIRYEKGIKSAHRTPDAMAEYAKTAASRGIKVIIAAAGGAAHLPGMVAAFSKSVVVVGLPIKPTIGDGMDSLLSMTNMPRGVPVATVGINNSTNAALTAARILAADDQGVREKLEEYADRAGEESLENDRKLGEDN
ncbi:phosphoribosylaminoimidazole carboxylase, partial [Lecanoromycetidae sp. Uapishka_2]